jgi:hypothetical protein
VATWFQKSLLFALRFMARSTLALGSRKLILQVVCEGTGGGSEIWC